MNLQNLSNKNILVIGASGQLGIEFSKLVVKNSNYVSLLRKGNWNEDNMGNVYKKLYSIDFFSLSRRQIKKLVANYDVIIYLAAVTTVQNSFAREHSIFIKQLSSLKSILHSCVNTKKRIIFASSCSTYGSTKEKIVNDASREFPLTSYDYIKAACDNLINYYKKIYKLDCVSIRFANIYGPDHHLQKIKNRRIINLFLDQMHLDHVVNIVGDGKFFKNYIHVSDAAKSILAVCQIEKINKSILIAASNENIYFIDVVKILAQHYKTIFKKDVDIRTGKNPKFKGDTKSYMMVASPEIQKYLTKQITLNVGLKQLVIEYKANLLNSNIKYE
tara:strand:- start:2544 stop:3536 length:993 start_codon:yes stop_codon:yes gene_type:complete